MPGYRVTIRCLICLALAGLMTAPAVLASAQGATPATPAGPEQPQGPVILFETAGDAEGGFFDVELEPGEKATLTVAMGNAGAMDFDAVVYAADAYTIRNGGFGLLELGSEPTGATNWLDFPTDTFTAPVGKSQERDFTITVPEDTPPGEYVTGIAMQTAEPVNEASDTGMFRFDQYYRTVIGVRIIVPGPLAPEIEVGEPTTDQEGNISALVIPISNTGNQQTQPSGEARVFDTDGQIVLTAPVQMGRVYGGHETELWLGLSAPLPEGTYIVSLELNDEDKDIAISSEGEMSVEATTTEVATSPITVASASIEPGPSGDNVQFAVVDATVSNTGEPVNNAQLSLLAFRDGEEVERFPISQSLSLPGGDTEVSTRYIPLEGWSPGEWTFELLLETVEGSGAAVVVASQPIEGSVTIP